MKRLSFPIEVGKAFYRFNKVGAATSKTKMTQTSKPDLHSGFGPWKRYVFGYV